MIIQHILCGSTFWHEVQALARSRQTYRKVVEHESEGNPIQWDLKFDNELQQDDPNQHKEDAEPRKSHVSVNKLGVLQQHECSVHSSMLHVS